MTGMLGGNPQEDMFAKLESMREIITEVNTQFKDAVSPGFWRRALRGVCRGIFGVWMGVRARVVRG